MKTPKITKKDYWECPRCNINSLGKSMCPCPRGSCEAEITGKVITTVEVILKAKKSIATTPKILFPSVEEMHCPTCKVVTGHSVKNDKWTCVHCNTPLK